MNMKECFCRGRNKECCHCGGFGFIRMDLSPPAALIYPSSLKSKNKTQINFHVKTKKRKKKDKIKNPITVGGMLFSQSSIGKELSIVNKGMAALNSGNILLAKELWIQEAESGNSMAQAALGLLYYKGLGVEKNLEKAFRWFFESAKNGHPKSQVNVATMFIRGQGVSKDLVSAYLWAKIASRKGNEKAKSLTERLETLLSAEDIAIVLEEVEKDRI